MSSLLAELPDEVVKSLENYGSADNMVWLIAQKLGFEEKSSINARYTLLGLNVAHFRKNPVTTHCDTVPRMRTAVSL